jgi:hypothetical protein
VIQRCAAQTAARAAATAAARDHPALNDIYAMPRISDCRPPEATLVWATTTHPIARGQTPPPTYESVVTRLPPIYPLVPSAPPLSVLNDLDGAL